MCWFITVAVPAQPCAVLERLAQGHQLRVTLSPAGDMPATARFPAGSSCVVVTRGGCSCELVGHDRKRRQPEHDAERARLARRGWSSAKIERALAAKAESASRPVGCRGDDGVIAFRELVGHAVCDYGAIQVLAHFYKGSPDAEAVERADAVSMTLEQFERTPIPEDTLVTIRA